MNFYMNVTEGCLWKKLIHLLRSSYVLSHICRYIGKQYSRVEKRLCLSTFQSIAINQNNKIPQVFTVKDSIELCKSNFANKLLSCKKIELIRKKHFFVT